MASDYDPTRSSGTAAPFVPGNLDLFALREAAAGCKGCDLYQRATQTVFGEGPQQAAVMMVGEQPGDQEDLSGHPFVGPAGALLNRACADAGLERAEVYVTNVVKHFKWEERGKRRIHKKPNSTEISACRPWFEAEMLSVRPAIIVCLGASAAQALMGADFRVTRQRGQLIDGHRLPTPIRATLLATVHPSAILRAPDEETRHKEYAAFVQDLKQVVRFLAQREAA